MTLRSKDLKNEQPNERSDKSNLTLPNTVCNQYGHSEHQPYTIFLVPVRYKNNTTKNHKSIVTDELYAAFSKSYAMQLSKVMSLL